MAKFSFRLALLSGLGGWLFMALAPVSLAAGTQPVGKKPTSASKPPAKPASAKPRAKAPVPVKKVAEVPLEWWKESTEKPYSNGAGIVIGEPSLAGENDADLAAFGAACSRWLQFTVGGQGELGKTPLWSQLDLARFEMHKPNFQLLPDDIGKVARALGPTHIMLGILSPAGNPGRYSLSYQLYDVSALESLEGTAGQETAQLLPAIPALEGTKAEIWAQLPAFAQSLSQKLGVKSPHLEKQAVLSEAEMSALGRGSWTFPGDISASDLTLLNDMAPREPLAALLALEFAVHQGFDSDWKTFIARQDQWQGTFCDSALKARMFDALLSGANENVLAWAEMGSIDINQLTPYDPNSDLAKKTLAIVHKYPETYVLREFAVGLNRQLNTGYDGESARRATLASPKNPYAWMQLSNSISNKAEEVRNSRVAADIGKDEWKVLKEMYGRENACAVREVALDPQNGWCWANHAAIATMNGESSLVKESFWKAAELEPTDPRLLRQGLESFQPKWSLDRESLDKVIALAEQPQNLPYTGLAAFRVLTIIGDGPGAVLLQKQTSDAFEKLVTEHPDDIQAVYGQILFKQAIGENATAEFPRLTELRPSSSLAFRLRGVLLANGGSAEGVAPLRQAIKLDPKNIYLHKDLAQALSVARLFPEAIHEFRFTLQVFPYDSNTYYKMALAYYNWGKLQESIDASLKVEELSPDYLDLDFANRLCDAQFRLGKYADAVESGQRAVMAASSQYYGDLAKIPQVNACRIAWAYAYYGWALVKSGDPESAAVMCHEALQLDGVNAGAHYCLAEIALVQGKKAQARIEWQKVVDSADLQSEEPKPHGYYAALAAARLKN